MTVAPFRTRLAGAFMAGACAVGLLHGCAAPDSATTEEVFDGVRAWIEAYEQTWNTHDAAAVAAYFAEDVDMIIGNGPRVVGRAGVADSWRSYFEGIDEARRGTFDIVSLRGLAPDVVVVEINSTTTGGTASGEELPTRLARGTWVVVRHDGEWQISVFRALPAEGEMRLAPGRDP